MFHVNPATGEPGKCTAKKQCPFGGLDKHFTSEEAARAAFEREQTAVPQAAKKIDGRNIRGAWPDLELYRKYIHPNAEIFVHPQGKIAFTGGLNQSRLSVKKAGKNASTSGTIDDLRAGRGAWKQVKGTYDPIPSKEDYEAQYASSVKVTGGTPVDPRTIENLNAGYPATSPYDARRAGEIATHPAYRESWSPSAILPLNERANPHKLADVAFGDSLRFWNHKDKDGNETTGSTFEVWKSPSGNYKAVVTSGDTVTELGTEGSFMHDQTHAHMGGKWTMVGAFRPIEGGAILGEVPNRSMPVYNYK